jgi:cell division septum initiation protein DivIVA
MNLTKAIKVFELNILRQSGITLTPQQVGLKSDPIADLQAQNATSNFSKILGNLGGGTSLTLPTVPTPPSDSTDTAAQAKYQQQLLTYNQQMQLYNQRYMQLMLNQLQSIQQSISSNSQSSSSSSASQSASTSSEALGIGGILD